MYTASQQRNENSGPKSASDINLLKPTGYYPYRQF